MRTLRAALLGAAAAGVVTYACAAALAVTLATGGATARIALGPLLLVSVESAPKATSTTFGLGILAIALVGGVINALVAGILRWRRRPEGEPMA